CISVLFGMPSVPPDRPPDWPGENNNIISNLEEGNPSNEDDCESARRRMEHVNSDGVQLYSGAVKQGMRKNNINGASLDWDKRYKWEVFVVIMEQKEDESFRAEKVKHIDVYEMALLFGFKEHELAGANTKFGLNQVGFYTKFPIDVRGRLNDLKKVHSFKVKSVGGSLVNISLKLKGVDKIEVNLKRKVLITMENTFKRINEDGAVQYLQKYGQVVTHYPKKNPSNEAAERKFKEYKNVWRDCDYIVELIADPATLPQVIPFQGCLIRLKFRGARVQCLNCFGHGHLKQDCSNTRLRLRDYDRVLKETLSSLNSKRAAGSQSTEEDACTGVRDSSIPRPPINSTPAVDIADTCVESSHLPLPSEEAAREEEVESIILPHQQELEGSACLDSSSIQMEAPHMMILNPPETVPETFSSPQPPEGSDRVRDEEPAVSQIICENGDCTTTPLNVEPSFMKTKNSYINPDLILKSRTRSGSLSKRTAPSIGLSPPKDTNPTKIQRN
ncbi:Uncharacterized protein FKW44_014625, partial [Caligus rogercresseyi]